MAARWNLWLAAGLLAAQAPPDLTLHVSVNLVQVDAVVTDSQGRHVASLEREDFEIFQDGRPQKLTHFSYIATQPPAPAAALPGTAPAPPPRLRPDQVRRTMALVVDDLGLSFESLARVRQALKKFVEEQIREGDLAAVIRTGAGMGAGQQFTADRRQLLATVERLRWNPLGRGGVSPFAPMDDGALEDPAEDGADPNATLDDFRQEIFSVGSLGALHFVVNGLRELPGRKSVVLFADDLRILNRDDINTRVRDSLERLTDLASRASVVIYAIDSRGLPTLSLTAQDRVTRGDAVRQAARLEQRRSDYLHSQDGLTQLAEQTGGLFLHGSNDLGEHLREVMDDQQGYYLIGYTPEASTFDAKTGRRLFRKITVRVRRPGLRVRSRSGFYALPDSEARAAPRGRDQQLDAALSSPFSSGAIPLKLTALFGNHATAGSFVHCFLHIDGRQITFDPPDGGWRQAVMDILLVTFDGEGTEVDRSNRTYTVRVRGEEYRRALRNGFIYRVYHSVKKPGAYQFRVAVRDAGSEKTGSANQYIEIPEVGKGRLALSGIVVRARDPKSQAGGPGSGEPEGRAEETDPEGNPAVRLFRPGRLMTYAFQILDARLDPATQKPRLETQVRLYRSGRQIFAGKPTPFDPGRQTEWKRLLAGGSLTLGKPLESGEYVLQVVVTDALASARRRTASQWVDFELLP